MKNRYDIKYTLILFVIALASGCGVRPVNLSDLSLRGGYVDNNGSKFPGVYGLAVDPSLDDLRAGRVRPSCTATAISPTVLVTAAHCLKKSNQALIYYFLDYNLSPLHNLAGSLLIGEAVAHPLSQFSSGSSWRQRYDLAFIRVQAPTFSSTYSFSERNISEGDDAQLVGFGVDRTGQQGGRQFGYNKIVTTLHPESRDPLGHPVREVYDTLLLVTYDRKLNTDPNRPANTGTVPGDSGGPLFVDGKIAGILYGGAYWNQQRDEENENERGRFDDSIYVNPRTPFHREFIENQRKQGWDIP